MVKLLKVWCRGCRGVSWGAVGWLVAHINAWMSSNLGQISEVTAELAAHEFLCFHYI